MATESCEAPNFQISNGRSAIRIELHPERDGSTTDNNFAVRQIIAHAELEPDELQLRLEQYLRDELVDIERQIAADRRDRS